jgi:biotin carboxyl carrier protein
MKKLRVTVEGKSYEVLVEIVGESTSPVPVQSQAAASAAPASVAPTPVALAQAPAKAAAGAGDIPSPLAGKVVSIDVKVGQAVDEGAQVATVEAMKMNTYIYAPKSGTVSAILVNAGDGVEEGSPLLRIG